MDAVCAKVNCDEGRRGWEDESGGRAGGECARFRPVASHEHDWVGERVCALVRAYSWNLSQATSKQLMFAASLRMDK